MKAEARARRDPKRGPKEGPAASVSPKPFIKWVGGKRQLMPALRAHLPEKFGRYYEPFVGGGALFFDLKPAQATLADANTRLVRTYVGLRDQVEAVIALLSTYRYDEECFYRMREIAIDERSDVEVAAWLIYLNRTGFNGLYRVNSKNRYNVPFGRYSNPTICDAPLLRASSQLLKRADIQNRDFEAVVEGAKASDLVYFDPPYAPVSVTSNFTSYGADGFGESDQRRLRDVALSLKQRGVHVLLSNSSAPLIRNLYAEGFDCIEVAATRRVNSDTEKRGNVVELLIR